MTVPIDTRMKARELFIIEGKSLTNASKMTGISERTLASWSAAEKWVEKRKKYLQALEDIDKNIFVIYAGVAKKAAESLDPQDVGMVLKLEEIIRKRKGE